MNHDKKQKKYDNQEKWATPIICWLPRPYLDKFQLVAPNLIGISLKSHSLCLAEEHPDLGNTYKYISSGR